MKNTKSIEQELIVIKNRFFFNLEIILHKKCCKYLPNQKENPALFNINNNYP